MLRKKHNIMFKRRNTKKVNSIIQSSIFFLGTISTIVSLIVYLWVFKEIDDSLLIIDIQTSTAKEIANEISEINNTIEFLSRTDNISNKAISELGMQVSYPETLQIYIDKKL